MTQQTFVAIHHTMSVEDPEQGTPPYVFGTSEDKQKLIDEAVDHMWDVDFETVKLVDINGETWIMGSFDENAPDSELSTYFVISSAPAL